MKYADLACPDCGPQEKMLFNAEVIRERDFEGVFFEITPRADGACEVKAAPDDADYLSDFNMPKILVEAAKIVDEGQKQYVVCPTCRESLE